MLRPLISVDCMATITQAWIWSDCRNVSFSDRTSHTTWNSYCAPNLCNYRSSDGQIMSFEFDQVTFNTPLQEASIVLSIALDDHYTQARLGRLRCD
jgi:hypothetical protein